MGRPRAATLARRDAILAVLGDGKTWRCKDLATEVGCTYNHAMQACIALEKLGHVEKVHSVDMQRLVPLEDGRVIQVGPDCGAVGWRATNLDIVDTVLEELEALWEHS